MSTKDRSIVIALAGRKSVSLLSLAEEYARELSRLAGSSDSRAILRRFAKYLKRPWRRRRDMFVLTAHDATDVAGFLCARIRGHTEKIGVIDDVYVRKDLRRMGIARTLVATALEKLREHGARRIFTEVLASNTPGENLMRSMGLVAASTTFCLDTERETRT